MPTATASSAHVRAVDLAVEVPPGGEVPLVLVPVTEQDGFTPQDLAIIESQADRFLLEASQGGAVLRPDPASWQAAQRQSDELFRTWYGSDAFMAMQARRHFEGQAPPQP